ncbi:MAG: hypothetical protein JOZ29_04955, partial [Deltaproteobacteria bacterium]|nr:hypothetical protein [Deltaproteobacteria bacterium]
MDRDTVGKCLAVGVAALLVAFSGSFGAASAQSDTAIIASAPAGNSAKYWTSDKMKAAVPMEMVRPGGPIVPETVPQPTGAPGIAGGSKPGQPGSQGLKLVPQSLLDESIRELALPISEPPVPADGPYPGPNDTFEYAPKYRKYPISTVGKLFFTEPGVGDFVCSAAVTTGGSAQNVIWTAGHCVANGGHATFFTNWLFCPSYDAAQGGPNPAVGCWGAAIVTTTAQWFNDGAFTRDYATIALQHSGTVVNADVATVTGGLGFAWNFPRDQHWIHLGYPAASPYTGGVIIETAAEHRYDDTPDSEGPPTNSWGSAHTGGSSGSAVILFFSYNG